MQHRTMHGERLKRGLACIFSVICAKNARESTKDSLRFLTHLTKNLTAQFRTLHCAVLH